MISGHFWNACRFRWLLPFLVFAIFRCCPLVSGHSENSQAEIENLRKLFPAISLQSKGVSVGFDCEVQAKRNGQTRHEAEVRQRFEFEWFENQSFRETIYEIQDDESQPDLPFSECLFDSQTFLSIAPRNDDNAPIRFHYFTSPTVIESIGTRCKGLLPFLGLTPFQTADDWNLLLIMEEAGFDMKLLDDGATEFTCQSPVGLIRLVSNNNQMTFLEIVATKPEEQFYGLKLGKFGDSLVKQTFFDFEYTGKAENDLMAPQRFKSIQTRHRANGDVFTQKIEFKLNHCKTIDGSLPNLFQEAKLKTPVSKDVEIAVIGNPHLKFKYRNGRIEKDFDLDMQSQLASIASQLHEGHVTTSDHNWVSPESSGMCGLFSLFSISEYLENDTPLSNLLVDRFCETANGSSSDNLRLAAKSIGLQSKSVAGLSVEDVAALSCPAILHVRPRGQADAFSHWVACFGENDEGTFNILDSSFGFEKMSPAELASRFDGSALVFAANEQDIADSLGELSRRRVIGAFAAGSMLLLIVLILNALAHRFTDHNQVITVATIGFSVLCAIGYQSVRPDGLLGAELDVARRLAANSTIEFPRVTMDEVKKMVVENDPGCVLVDSRYQNNYRHATIGNAVNYPLDIRSDAEQELIVKLKKSDKIVVFCQSATCPFSEQIGRRLVTMGVQNVHLFDGGINLWSEDAK